MSTFPSKDMDKYAESIPVRFIQGMRVDEVINYAIFIHVERKMLLSSGGRGRCRTK